MTRQNESDDNDLFSSKSEEETETNKNNRLLIPYVHQKVAIPKAALRKSTAASAARRRLDNDIY